MKWPVPVDQDGPSNQDVGGVAASATEAAPDHTWRERRVERSAVRHVERRDICAESDGLRPSLASGQRVNVPQTIRGVNGASNEVPLGTSSVVMFAAMPPGVPKNDNCADPETEVAQVPTPLI
jgi:hypothetical protein